MTPISELFKEFHISNIFKVRIGNEDHIVMKGKRIIAIKIHLGVKLNFFYVLYVSKINQNLLIENIWLIYFI